MTRTDEDARLMAILLAIDPLNLKGALVHGVSRGGLEAWMQAYVALLPSDAPVRRIPFNISDERLLGGLDFAATIACGRPVAERGVLSDAHTGCVTLSTTKISRSTWAHLTRVLDAGEVRIERDGLAQHWPAQFTVVALELSDDDPAPAALLDRLAFLVDLRATSELLWQQPMSAESVRSARARLPLVLSTDETLSALCNGAHAVGVHSPRIILLALAVARANAARRGVSTVEREDLDCAARLVFAPRMFSNDELQPPAPVTDEEAQASPSTSSGDSSAAASNESAAHDDGGTVTELSEVVVRAVRSALPSGLLSVAAARAASSTKAGGRAGASAAQGNRGRQVGTRRGDPKGGARLDLVATLRAALPMQRIRRTLRADRSAPLVAVRRDDFRVRRCVSPSTTTTLFVVDASGSSALHRLSEVKGAVELMLAEGYARRDRVAVIAFRGTTAELVLPPTHALARARRAIAGMPSGGGTPLATAIDLAVRVVGTLQRDASQVVTVVLTDGRANVGRDGRGGRARAEADALDAARRLGAMPCDVVWIDSAPRPEPISRELARVLGARYVALPSPTAAGMKDLARSMSGLTTDTAPA